MDIVARLIQVIHWIVFIPAILILIIGVLAFTIDSNAEPLNDLIDFMLLDFDNSSETPIGIVLDCTIIMPFIRYIIFGRIGWFPWTPFRKE
jgi:hypothetical protein